MGLERATLRRWKVAPPVCEARSLCHTVKRGGLRAAGRARFASAARVPRPPEPSCFTQRGLRVGARAAAAETRHLNGGPRWGFARAPWPDAACDEECCARDAGESAAEPQSEPSCALRRFVYTSARQDLGAERGSSGNDGDETPLVLRTVAPRVAVPSLRAT